MIPLDLSVITSTPRGADSRLIGEDSPQKVPNMSPRDNGVADDCGCCAHDVTPTSARSGDNRIRPNNQTRSSLRPRIGRVHRTGLAARRSRCQMSRQCTFEFPSAEEPMQVNAEINGSGFHIAASDIPQALSLPLDPRQWSRDQVHSWLRQMELAHKFAASDFVITERFPMNGKGLCLMVTKPEMFESRVPCGGGRVLLKDLTSRLLRALAIGSGGDQSMNYCNVARRQLELKAVS